VSYVGTITIREGETKQLISVPDKATGEVEKVEVTLTLETPRRASIELKRYQYQSGDCISIFVELAGSGKRKQHCSKYSRTS
jgi:hypothetical protein